MALFVSQSDLSAPGDDSIVIRAIHQQLAGQAQSLAGQAQSLAGQAQPLVMQAQPLVMQAAGQRSDGEQAERGQAPSERVDTRRVGSRRTVTYESYQDLLNDVLVMRVGGYRTVGNWSLGQILEHLARLMHMSVDGLGLVAPWYVRLVGRYWWRRRVLRGPLRPGVRMAPGAERRLIPEFTPVTEGLANLRKAVERLQCETDREPHPVIGELSLSEWDAYHLRHAELHMSFVVADQGAGWLNPPIPVRNVHAGMWA